MKTVFTIDPGVSGTGLAIWNADLFGVGKFPYEGYPPTKIMSIRYKDTASYFNTLQYGIRQLGCLKIICEDVDYRKGDKGQMVAESGDLVTLAKFIGAIQGIAFCEGVPIELVTANIWKGQLNKAKVVARLKKICPSLTNFCGDEEKAHDWEAVGIGFWKQGVF